MRCLKRASSNTSRGKSSGAATEPAQTNNTVQQSIRRNRLDHPLRIGSGVGKVKEVGWAGFQFASAPVIDIRQVDYPFNAFLAENFPPWLKNVGVAHPVFPKKNRPLPQNVRVGDVAFGSTKAASAGSTKRLL